MLNEYGLNESESRIYLYLSKNGATGAGKISQALSIGRSQSYGILKGLQEKGLVYSVPVRPVRFDAVELPKALNILIEAHRSRERVMQKIKERVLSSWKETTIAKIDVPHDRFQFLRGMESICRRAIESLHESKKEAIAVSLEASLYFLDRFSVVDELEKLAESGISVRFLAEATPSAKNMLNELQKVKARQLTRQHIPDMLIVDGSEMVLFTKTLKSVDSKEITGIWTNSTLMINTMKHLFEETWIEAAEPTQTNVEIGKGPSAETLSQLSKDTAALKREMEKWLTAAGFDVSENTSIKGVSGTAHSFSIAFTRGVGKPIVIDIEHSDDLMTPAAVLSFFAKVLDVKDSVGGCTLVVDPGLDPRAAKLAKAYQISYRELPQT